MPWPACCSQVWASWLSCSCRAATCSARTVKPPAAGWPPKRSSRGAHCCRAPSTAKPRGARTEARRRPLPSPASRAAGRPKRSTSRAATMPITPWCQWFWASSRKAGRWGPSASSRARASASMAVQRSRRWRLSASQSRARARARLGSSVVSNSTTSWGSPSRPTALIRGAIWKPTAWASRGVSSRPACCCRAWSPTRGLRPSSGRPSISQRRFTPTSGAMSAIVPIQNRLRAICWPSVCRRLWQSAAAST